MFSARDRDARQACGHQQAVHGNRSDSQVTGGAENPVHDLGQKRSIQSVHHGQSGNHGIRLGNQHDPHSRPAGQSPRQSVGIFLSQEAAGRNSWRRTLRGVVVGEVSIHELEDM